LILLWSPLLTFELAHSAHLDGLVLPLLVGAWWARARERDGLSGTLLGLAAAMKLYPVLLLPALWRSTLPRQRKYNMPLAFAITVAVCYLPYLLSSGAGVIGFLPDYFQQQFNIAPLVQGLLALLQGLGLDPKQGLSLIFSGSLLLIGGWMVLRPANNAQDAIRRSLWMIGAFTLLSQNLFSWYMLWLLPLLAIFMEPGRLRLAGLSLPRFNAWTGWWLFCGLVGLSYSFFIRWKPVPAALWAQFLPLYLFLLAGGIRSLSTSMKSGYPLKKTFMSFIHSIDRRSPMFGKLRLDVVDSNREASDSD
jgi:hypothetical protein